METKELIFQVREANAKAYILWPWKTTEDFLYSALEWGAKYRLREPSPRSRLQWIEFVPTSSGCHDGGAHGEYQYGLLFGDTAWGHAVYRVFNARSSHYLTQHGLDGLPERLWHAAYEPTPGQPMGDVRITFRVGTAQGAFQMSHYDWMHYFVSGRNEHISKMALSPATKPISRRGGVPR